MFYGSKRGTARLLAAIVLSIVLLVALTGCGARGADSATQQPGVPAEAGVTFPITLEDDAGREVVIESEPRRIVSLAPSNTEIVYALGLIDRLVGVTTFCDYPAQVGEIDKIGDFIQPNIEAITAANPDLILMTTGVQADVVEQLEGTGAAVLAINPKSLEDLFVSIRIVGQATATADTAEEVIASMQAELDEISAAVADRERVRVFIEVAQNPLFTAGTGTLINDLINAAGGENVVTQEGYVGYSIEQLVTDDPAAYLATKGSMSDPADLEQRQGFAGLSAVKNDRVYVLEDNLVSRPGPRVVQGVRQIAESLHPTAF